MEAEEIEQYKELMKEVNEVKEALSLNSSDTALLLMIYDELLVREDSDE